MPQLYRFLCFGGKYIIAISLFTSSFQFNIDLTQSSLSLSRAYAGQTQDKKLLQDLMRAAISGNIGKVKRAIIQGADVDGLMNLYGNGVRTALMFVSRRNFNHSDIAKVLLEAGANPNLQDEDGKTALMFAAQNNHAGIVDLLLDGGADPFIEDSEGKSVLPYAAQAGGVEIIKRLTQEYNLEDNDDYLEKAIISSVARTNNISLLKEIKNPKKYLNYHLERDDKQTPIMYAAYYGSNNAIESFIQLGDDLKKVDIYGNTLLHWAVFNGQFETVRLLLKDNLDPLTPNNEGKIPLISAGSEIAKFLLERNPNSIYIKDNLGQNAIDYAFERKQRKKIRLFESKEIKFTQKQIQQAFFIEAAHREYSDKPQNPGDSHKFLINDNSKLEEYLALGADINAKNDDGMTALMLAIFWASLDKAEFLLKQGADPHIIDDKYKNIAFCKTGSTGNYWGYYEEEYYLRIVELIHEYNLNPNTCNFLVDAAISNYIEVTKLLIINGADVNQSASSDKHPLYLAVSRNNYEVVKILLDSGATHEKVMEEAIEEGYYSIAKLLADRGFVDRNAIFQAITENTVSLLQYFFNISGFENLVNSVDEYNKTPLMFAATLGRPQMVEILLQNNADPNISSNFLNREGEITSLNGVTALTNAIKGGHDEVVRLLLMNNADPNLNAIDDPLFLAVDKNRPNIVSMLLKAGARGNRNYSNFKESLLMNAVSKSQLEIINHLLDYGTDVDYVNPGNSYNDFVIGHSHFKGTPLMWAAHKKQYEAAKLLIKRGADIEKSLKLSINQNRTNIYNKILYLDQNIQ